MKTLPLSDNEARCLKDYILFSVEQMERTMMKDSERLGEMMENPYLEPVAKEFAKYVEREREAISTAKEIVEDL